MKTKEKLPTPGAELRLERQQRTALKRFFRATEALGEKATVKIRGRAADFTYFGHRRRPRAKSG
ncbi:MAG TPA: hypothetical protein VGB13_13400 [Candidatus Krumholzibacteria bacterium]